VAVAEHLAFLVRYDGSFFALKLAVEPIVARDLPDPLIIYVPGVEPNPVGSVLGEIEKAGRVWTPRFGQYAISTLKRKFSDGQIDEMLASDSLSYQDVVALLGQQSEEPASRVKLVLGEGPSEEILARWISDESNDEALLAKDAVPELLHLIKARLGLSVEDGTPPVKARHHVARYVLVNEFRLDLGCEAPASLFVVPAPGRAEEADRIREVARWLREKKQDAYITLADAVEAEFGLAELGIPAASLGSIDTFRFEERALLALAGKLVVQGKTEAAMQFVEERKSSFWLDRDFGRLSQWDACCLAAELTQEVKRVRGQVGAAGDRAEDWVRAYAGENGWFRADLAHRSLEEALARMQDEPEPAVETAIDAARQGYETLLGAMATGFADTLRASKWTVSGVLHQTRVYPEHVMAAGGRVAYFLVDGLRYEMAHDLVKLLSGALELRLLPCVAALPSITPVGMAALLPGAAAAFSVIEDGGKLAARVGDSATSTQADRGRHLGAVAPEAADIDIGTLLQKPSSKLPKKLGSCPVAVVRCQGIDALGEVDGATVARAAMTAVLGNVARAVRKIAALGFERVVVTADHGYLFSGRKGEDMVMDRPAGGRAPSLLGGPRRQDSFRVCARVRGRAGLPDRPRLRLPEGPGGLPGRGQPGVPSWRNQPAGDGQPCPVSPVPFGGRSCEVDWPQGCSGGSPPRPVQSHLRADVEGRLGAVRCW